MIYYRGRDRECVLCSFLTHLLLFVPVERQKGGPHIFVNHMRPFQVLTGGISRYGEGLSLMQLVPFLLTAGLHGLHCCAEL